MSVKKLLKYIKNARMNEMLIASVIIVTSIGMGYLLLIVDIHDRGFDKNTVDMVNSADIIDNIYSISDENYLPGRYFIEIIHLGGEGSQIQSEVARELDDGFGSLLDSKKFISSEINNGGNILWVACKRDEYIPVKAFSSTNSEIIKYDATTSGYGLVLNDKISPIKNSIRVICEKK